MKYLAIFLVLLAFSACNAQEDDLAPLPPETGNEIIDGDSIETYCADTDAGKDVITKGTVQTQSDSFTDECVDETTLREHYCDLGVVKTEELVCDGFCQEGKCVSWVEGSCIDSDKGVFYDVKGIVTDSAGETFEDYCAEGLIYEAVCDSYGFGKFKTNDCAVCEDGVCIQERQDNPVEPCYDSDGGMNYEEKGTASDSMGRNETDECTSSKFLKEYYCDSYGFVKSDTFRCLCEDGVCIGPA